MNKRQLLTLGAALLIGSCISLPAMADSFSYSLTIDKCTGGCGSAPFGTVTVADVGVGQVSLSITVDPNFFVLTGPSGGGSTVAFNLAGNPTISISSSSPLSGWSLDSGGAPGSHG